MDLIAPADEWLDALHAAHDAARKLPREGLGMVGYGVAHLIDGDGKTAQLVPFSNMILDPGDVFVAAQIIRGIAPASPGAPSLVPNGMKLGTGSTAVNKAAGTGTALTTYLSGSQAAFDASYPQTSGTLGVNLGANAIFKTTWAAGTPAGTNTITECVIVTDSATNATTTAANTFSRAVLSSSVVKTSTDSLAITWNYKALGS